MLFSFWYFCLICLILSFSHFEALFEAWKQNESRDAHQSKRNGPKCNSSRPEHVRTNKVIFRVASIVPSNLFDSNHPFYFVIQGVQENLCFFQSRLHRCTFKALNIMRVYSHSYWLVIVVQPIAAECWRGRILEKKHNI